MSVIKDLDLDEITFIPPRKKPENTLFCSEWEVRDTDLPGFKRFLGISLHLSEEQRASFRRQLYRHYNEKFGDAVPDTYMNDLELFEVVADNVLYRYVTESTGEIRKGSFITIPNLKYVSRLNLVQLSKDIERIIEAKGGDFREDLMTTDRILREISDDTNLWYEHQN